MRLTVIISNTNEVLLEEKYISLCRKQYNAYISYHIIYRKVPHVHSPGLQLKSKIHMTIVRLLIFYS